MLPLVPHSWGPCEDWTRSSLAGPITVGVSIPFQFESGSRAIGPRSQFRGSGTELTPGMVGRSP